jgi:hypothetical protein
MLTFAGVTLWHPHDSCVTPPRQSANLYSVARRSGLPVSHEKRVDAGPGARWLPLETPLARTPSRAYPRVILGIT